MVYVQTRRVDRNGRIILTRELQAFLGVGPGGSVEFSPTPEGVLIRKAGGGAREGAVGVSAKKQKSRPPLRGVA